MDQSKLVEAQEAEVKEAFERCYDLLQPLTHNQRSNAVQGLIGILGIYIPSTR